ncbi:MULTISPECIES: DUF4238 domain-containing protein [Rhodopseudomonas]|uniref:DUF4238 domain-containing protein n=1 Tax=Rhodopseudomonas TaxID=1073 RepID=UPI0005C9E88D|nr:MULTISPECIES: DUF4238 domain-containing protein [Rhodopseudomonas]MDF3813881.1 DUF4238 domain-containing protein [Rhodopseudomonas sp. BAL398]WOK15471.1 DUF4238 domain-containing protein [Rhodopseudomonas sp. BAL398]
MGQPRDHHFVPVFYLRQWHDAGGRLFEHRKVFGGRVVQKPVGADGSGFQRDLYAFPTLGPQGLDQHLENKFFQIVDDEGARALHRLIARDPEPWTADARSGWSRFLLSLRLRHPDAMDELRLAIPLIWGRGHAPSQIAYEEIRKPGDPEKFEEFVFKRDPLVVEKVTVNLIMRAIENVQIGTHVNGMKWRVIDLSKSKHDLITSDRPAHYAAIGELNGFISLPIGPRKLFLAANSQNVFDCVTRADQSRVVSEVNKKVASQARRYIYTRSPSSNQPLILRYFGVAQEKTPLFPMHEP